MAAKSCREQAACRGRQHGIVGCWGCPFEAEMRANWNIYLARLRGVQESAG